MDAPQFNLVGRAAYGKSMSCRVTSGHGETNPGPSSVPRFMGGHAAGEMLGGAADESGTAQYTPTTHTVEVPRLNKPVFEGALVGVKKENGPPTGHHAAATLWTNGTLDGYMIKPLAADAFMSTTRRGREKMVLALAYTGRCVVDCADTECVAGAKIYAVDDGGVLKVTTTPTPHLLGRATVACVKGDRALQLCLVP